MIKAIEMNAIETNEGESLAMVYVLSYQFNTLHSGWVDMMEIYKTRELADKHMQRAIALDGLYRNAKVSNRIVWNH